MKKTLVLLLIVGTITSFVRQTCAQTPVEQYTQLQRNLASGWNTWDTRSVLLPWGAAVDLNLTSADGNRMNTFPIGSRRNGAQCVRAHTRTTGHTPTSRSNGVHCSASLR